MQLQKVRERFAAAAAAWLRDLAKTAPKVRKAAGKARSQSALLQAVLECAPEIIFVKDREGRVITANRAYFASFGRTPEQVLGFDASAFVSDPELLHLTRQSDQKVLSTGRPLRQEFWYQDPAGSRRYFETRLAPLFSQSGLVEGLVGVVLDLTKVKNTEEALRASEVRLEAHSAALARLHEVSSRLWHKRDLREGLDEMLAGAIELMGADIGNVQILDAARGVLEIAAQRGFKQDFLDLFRKVSIADDTACGRALRSGERVVIEDIEADPGYTPYRAAARAAGYRAVQSTPIVARDGVPLGMLSTHFRQPRRPLEESLRLLDLYVRQVADFIERCRGDEALRDREAGRRLAQQAAKIGSFECNIQTGVNTWTPELEAMHGLSPGEFGKTQPAWKQLVHPEDRAAATGWIKQAIETGEPFEREWRIVWPDGSVHWISARFQVFKDAAGRPLRLTGVNIDITGRKRMEFALQWSARRNELLSMAATRLLESENPQEIVAELCKAAMDFLDCQAFLSYLFDEREGRLRLNAYAGIPDNEARRTEWLDLGQAICGCAAKDRKRIIAENISQTNHTRTELIKSLGIKAHCCHPLIVQGRLIGTLSFGSNSRLVFSAIEIEVMKGMADLIAIAMHRIKVEQSLHENEERLRLAAQTARFGIHDYDAAAERTLWSPELYAIAGLVPGTEVNNDVMMSTVHPADRPKVRDAIRAALSPAGGGIFDQEFRIVRQDTGETRWVQNRCQTLFRDSPEGRRIIRNVGVAVDITERKKREEQLQLLMREVNHRAKNLLAVVQSIACQTAKSGAGGDFAAIFQERLAGLAASQELLVASEWKGISLEDLIHAQLSHFGAPKDQRLFLHGPALAVSPPAAQTLGMAFHELGTNAIKYGALSNESGTVRIDWDVTRAPESRFRLTWIERGGPPAVPPGRRGFGTTVLTEMAELGLDGEIVLEFPPGGLIWQVTAPAALVLDAREQPALEARPS